MPSDLSYMSSNQQRQVELGFPSSWQNLVHNFTLTLKGPLYLLRPNDTLILVYFQQSLTQACHLLFGVLMYTRTCIFIDDSNIKDSNMCMNHITNGCLWKEHKWPALTVATAKIRNNLNQRIYFKKKNIVKNLNDGFVFQICYSLRNWVY